MNICQSCRSSFHVRDEESRKEILKCWPDGDSSKEQLAVPCDKFSRDGIVPEDKRGNGGHGWFGLDSVQMS